MVPDVFGGSSFEPVHKTHVGVLQYETKNDRSATRPDLTEIISSRTADINLFAEEELIIGRDKRTCHVVVETRCVSNKHMRLYAVIFDTEERENIAPLVYAETLSSNGAWWNGTFVTKADGPMLLSDGDTLRISKFDAFMFRCENDAKMTQCLSEIQEREAVLFQNEYEISDRLVGTGAYGRIHMARDKVTSRQMVCKVVDISQARRKIHQLEGADVADAATAGGNCRAANDKATRRTLIQSIMRRLKSFDREFQILQDLCHPNIIGIEKVFKTDHTIYIFQELLTGGDLFSFLERKGGILLEIEAAVIVRQILLALDYLHGHHIAHRDLKPDNVLLTSLASGTRVILTDFGCARYFQEEGVRMHSFMGTYEYTAPEIEKKGCSPFFDPTTIGFSETLAQSSCIYQSETDPDWVRLGDRSKDFVRRLLVVKAEDRMTAKQALTHKWFTNRGHKREFEAVYERALRNWKPRRTVRSIVTDYSTDREVRTCHRPSRRTTSGKNTPTECASISKHTQQVMMATTGSVCHRGPGTEAAMESIPLLVPVSGENNRNRIERSTGKKTSRVHFTQKAQSTASSQTPDARKTPNFVPDAHQSKDNGRACRLPFSRDAWNCSINPRSTAKESGPSDEVGGWGAAVTRRRTTTGKRKAPADALEDEDTVFEEREDFVTGSKVKVAYASRF